MTYTDTESVKACNTDNTPIAVIGAGAWGSALAIRLAHNNHAVRLYERETSIRTNIRTTRRNPTYLPDTCTFPETISVHDTIAEAIAPCRHILLAIPSHAFQSVLQTTETTGRSICWATKGFVCEKTPFLHDVFTDSTQGCAGAGTVLSGPSFAALVAAEKATAVLFASQDQAEATTWAQLFHGGLFRAYIGSDMVGVHICGALKNAYAVTSGIADGMHLGANARAALITRALAEIRRFGAAFGAQTETFFGLAGIGDLLLTATDTLSRNYRYGVLIGEGRTPEQAQSTLGLLVEGARCAPIAHALARARNIDMPILAGICAVLQGTQSATETMHALFARAVTHE